MKSMFNLYRNAVCKKQNKYSESDIMHFLGPTWLHGQVCYMIRKMWIFVVHLFCRNTMSQQENCKKSKLASQAIIHKDDIYNIEYHAKYRLTDAHAGLPSGWEHYNADMKSAYSACLTVLHTLLSAGKTHICTFISSTLVTSIITTLNISSDTS